MTRCTTSRARRDPDALWMRAYAADDLSALAPLFDLYAPRFLGLYRHCLRDAAAAEQLLEATFAEVHRVRHAYRRCTDVRLWLFGIAARLCIDTLESRERRERRSNPDAHRGSRPTAENVVHAALGSLDGSARLVLYLHRYEGMSFAEIAEVLGSSAQAVRTQALQTYSSLHERLRPLIERRENP